MVSPVLPPSSLSAADRPGAMLNIEPPPGGTTKSFTPFSCSLYVHDDRHSF
jgi:hypothetical protein